LRDSDRAGKKGNAEFDAVDYDRLINVRILLPAFKKATKILGYPMTELLLDDLRRGAIDLTGNQNYSFDQLREGMKRLFGVEASALLLEAIKASSVMLRPISLHNCAVETVCRLKSSWP
jgi:hypothetical protein